MATNSNRVNVFGLGKIGTILSGLLASKGVKVFGFDPYPEYFGKLADGTNKSPEPEFGRYVDACKEVAVNVMIREEFQSAAFSIIIVPTPSEDSGAYSLEYVVSAVHEILSQLETDSEHIIVIKSTVLPGDVRKLEAIAQVRGYPKVEFVYNPEFIALGDVIGNMSRPDLVLIGSRSAEVAEKVLGLNRLLIENQPQIAILDIEEAELAKVALNSYITLKITFANLIGNAAERLGSKNSTKVLEAIGSDSRIGNKYFRPGLGFGGPCFPRDNKALAKSLNDHGLNGNLMAEVDRVNKSLPAIFAEALQKELWALDNVMPKVLIVGAAYKVGSPETVESQSIDVMRILLEKHPNTQIDVFDPLVNELPKDLSRQSIRLINDKQLQSYDAVFVALPYLSADELTPYVKTGGKVIAPWGN